MTCHQAIKTDSPHIQQLAAAAKEKKPIPWVRVYRLPESVYFSHRVHTKAGAACDTCHGPVAEREVITKEVANNMKFCMACHAASKAPDNCDTCHGERWSPFSPQRLRRSQFFCRHSTRAVRRSCYLGRMKFEFT